VIAQPRSSQRYVGQKAERDRRLSERMIELSGENPRYGYRRVWALLRREGWPVNKKRVHRLWRQEGLKVPQKQCKRRRLLLGESENGCTRRQAEHKDHVWSYDFVMDLTEEGRRLKMMPIVDEYTRECLSIDVERSITAQDVLRTLASVFRSRGEPAFIRSDNGPEFIARAIKEWLEVSGVRTLYIEPGSPWENAYSETFISRFSDELGLTRLHGSSENLMKRNRRLSGREVRSLSSQRRVRAASTDQTCRARTSNASRA